MQQPALSSQIGLTHLAQASGVMSLKPTSEGRKHGRCKGNAVLQACGDRMLPERVLRQAQQRAWQVSGAMSSTPTARWLEYQGMIC